MVIEESIINKIKNIRNLTNTEKYISQKIIDFPSIIVETDKIQVIAEKLEVSVSVIFRFLNKIGFDSFSEFKTWIKFQKILNKNEDPYFTSVKNTITKIQNYDFSELNLTIKNSKKIIVTGAVSSKFLAESLNSKLVKKGFNSDFILIEDFGWYKTIPNDTIIIVVSFSGQGMIELIKKMQSANISINYIKFILISSSKPKAEATSYAHLVFYGDTVEVWGPVERLLPLNSEILCNIVINEIIKNIN